MMVTTRTLGYTVLQRQEWGDDHEFGFFLTPEIPRTRDEALAEYNGLLKLGITPSELMLARLEPDAKLSSATMRTHLIGGPHHGKTIWGDTPEHFEFGGRNYRMFKRATHAETWHGMHLVVGDALAEHVET